MGKVKNTKSDPTLVLTSVLLFLMLLAGIGSGIIGFASGHAALKGVTQPDVRPNTGTGNSQGVKILKEDDIIAKAKKVISLSDGKEKPKSPQDGNSKLPSTVTLPVTVEDQGISMVVKSIKTENNEIKLDLGLKNSGSQSIKLDQDLLKLSNGDGNNISGEIVGLPNELDATGKEASIKITLDPNTLGNSERLSLELTDWERKIKLNASNLPVKQ
jgi:hypothetical protein